MRSKLMFLVLCAAIGCGGGNERVADGAASLDGVLDLTRSDAAGADLGGGVTVVDSGTTSGPKGLIFAHDVGLTPLALAVDSQGRSSILYSPVPFVGGVRSFDAAGNRVADYRLPVPLPSITPAKNVVRAFTVDQQGNIAFTGSTDGQFPGEPGPPDQTYDCVVGLVEPNGTKLWTHQLGTDRSIANRGDCANSTPQAIAAEGDNIIVVGMVKGLIPDQLDTDNSAIYRAGGGTIFGSIFVAKYDTKGARLWVRQLLGDLVSAVATDATGAIYVAGKAPDATERAMIAKLSPEGALLWTMIVDQIVGTPQRVAVSSDGSGISLAGRTGRDLSMPDNPRGGLNISGAFVARFSAAGVYQWGVTYFAKRNAATDPGNCPSSPNICYEHTTNLDALVASKNGAAVFFAGHTAGFFGSKMIQMNYGVENGFLGRFDPAGKESWFEEYLYPFAATDPPGIADMPIDLAIDPNGDLVLLGKGGPGFFLARFKDQQF